MKRGRLLSATAAVTVLGVGFGSPLLAFGSAGQLLASSVLYKADSSNVLIEVANSGGVNCRGGDVCVEKIGDSAKVSWEIQTSAAGYVESSSSPEVTAVLGGTVIAVPKVLQNLELETIALPEPAELTSGSSALSIDTKSVSKLVPLVEQTTPLYAEKMPLEDSSPAPSAVAPSLTTPEDDWQVNLYTDYLQLYSDNVDFLGGEAAKEYVEENPTKGFNEIIFPGFVPEPQLQEVYDILDESWDKVVGNYMNNRYFYERYIPYWLEALKSEDVEGLSYSPLLALVSALETQTHSFSEKQPTSRLFNFVDAMAAVEQEHPDVLEPAEPLLSEEDIINRRVPGKWKDVLLTKEDQDLIYGQYYVDDTTEIDEEAIAYPAQERHEALAQQTEQLYDAYDAYFIEVARNGFAEGVFEPENADLYNYLYVPPSIDSLGVSSFKLTGTVEVESEMTYLPVRVWRSFDMHMYVDNTLAYVVHPSGTPGEYSSSMPALPDYSLTDPQVNSEIAGLQTDASKGVDATEEFRPTSAETDGRLGSMQCAPTSEKYGVWNSLGMDNVQSPEYSSTIFLPNSSGEDGCDQADVVVTLCAEDEPTTDKPEEPTTPPTEPTTPPTEPVVDTPVVDDEPESDSPVTTTDEAVADVVKTSTESSLPKTGLSIAGLSLAAILLIAGGVVAARRTRQEV